MKTLELSNYGVTEMNLEEMKETDGGGKFWQALWIVACTIVTVLLLASATITFGN